MNPLGITVIVLALVCLIWFDACLYFQIQLMDNNELNDNMYSLPPAMRSHNNLMSKSLESILNLTSFAFHGLSVKLMMTDPVDNYVMGPLSELFAQWCDFRENFHFISANMVSYAGVVSALIAAKLVTHEKPLMNKLSVLFFQLRTWLDDLDGVVARSRLGIYKHVSLQNTSGYVIDGVCDAIGFVAYIIGCYLYLKNNINRRQTSNSHLTSSSSSSQQHNHSNRRSIERYNLKLINNDNSSPPVSYEPVQQQEITEYSDDADSIMSQSYEEDEEVEILCNNSSCQVTPKDVDDEDEEENNKKWTDHNMRHFTNLASTMRMPREYLSKTSRILMDHIQPVSRNGKLSDLVFYRYIKDKIRKNLMTDRRLMMLIVCFLLQLALCSAFWNRYILVYRDLLESRSSSSTQARVKRQILKSNIMFILIWFWRLTNGHSFMQMLAGSIFFDKLWQFLELIKYLGFIEIFTLATITELHVIDVRNYLSSSTDI